jgi:peptide chain release factor subunit 1
MLAQLTATKAGRNEEPGRGNALAEPMPSARTLDRIARLHGEGLPVVSVYLAVHPGPDARRTLRTKADSLLHQVRSLASDGSLDHDARMSLRADIERIERIARTEMQGRGTLVIFGCNGAGVLELVRLPRPVRDRIMVDATPWIGPMLAVLDQYRRGCAVVMDRESAHVWELYLGELRDVGRLERRAPRSTAHAGGHGHADRRVRNKADEVSKRHFRELAAALDRLFRADRYDVLAVGGHEHELPGFLDFLPRTLRERVAGTFAIDPRTATAATVRQHVEPILERYQLDEEQRSVSEALEAVASSGLAVAGLEPCLWAGSVAAVRALLVQDGAVAPGVVCDASGWFATSGDACPLCGGPTRSTPDVIDELVEAVIDEGGSIQHVRADTELRAHLTVACLRFALPPGPQSAEEARP